MLTNTLLSSLVDPRERHIVRAMFLQGKTLETVGGELGITKERVRQLKVRAMKSLRETARICDFQYEAA
jgi:RNA polymerase sigma factor (sigma-70 family)